MSASYFQEDEVAGAVYDSRLVRRLWKFVLPYTGAMFFGVLLVLGGMAMYLVNPFILGRVVDLGIKTKNVDVLKALAMLYVIIECAVFMLSMLQNFVLRYIGQKIMMDIRIHLFKHIQKLPMSFFDRNPVGRLVTRMTNDVASLAELFSSGLIVTIGNVFLLVGISGVLIALNPVLGTSTLMTIPLLGGGAFFFQKKLRGAFRLVRSCIARVNSALSENISGVKVVQIFNQEARRAAKFGVLNGEHREAQLQSVFFHSLLAPYVTIVNALAIVMILILGGRMVIHGGMSIGVLISFLAYVHYFFFPIREIAEKVTIFQSAMASAERIFSLIDEPVEKEVSPAEVSEKEVSDKEKKELTGSGEVRVDRVTFSYQPDRPVLRSVSFVVSGGESIAIVGQTGAGKTTIGALLNRFYEIETGGIFLDGRNIQEIPKPILRRNVVVIQQEVFIFSGTVLENIRLGDTEISLEMTQEAARQTGADEFIQGLPGGYGAEIAERGANLSVGQRQLLAFTRTLVFRPKVLVLDEATSSVDSETEKCIQTAIERLMEGRTCLMIAHRLSTIRRCRRILVFHKGRLVEEGSHDELLAKRGRYFRLHELQFKENGVS